METESISETLTLKNIMKFALPTIAMSLFMAFYTMVDGLFVSQSDRSKRLIRNQFICAYHFLSHSHLYHAGNRWKRCNHEKSR